MWKLIVIAYLMHFYSTNAIEDVGVNREPRIWGWGWWGGIGIVRFENKFCLTNEGLSGTCFTRRQCRDLGGTSSGPCAGKVGKCCLITKGCGEIAVLNNTYFVNPSFPSPVTGSTTCTFVIEKMSPDICQVRIDFLSLTLAQPNGIGICVQDSLRIRGAATVVPPICGENSGKHVYLNFNRNHDITITVVTTGNFATGRSWYFKVAQLGCDSPSRAPDGCLMYYGDTSGTVSSFNFGIARSTEVNAPNIIGTRELANLNYGICIRQAPGFCSIEWSEAATGSFVVSGDPESGVAVTDCTMDFVIVPNPIPSTGAFHDRFCGYSFPTVVSASKPFVIYYITDAGESNTESGNLGFSLNYRLIGCNPLDL